MAIRQLLNSATKQKCIITYDDTQIYHVARWETGGQEAAHVLPGILAGCDAAGITPDELSSILIVNGPGSFTGLRVAVTVVNMIKTTVPTLSLYTITAGQLLAHADGYKSSRYVFAPYPSDIFLFDQQGAFEERLSMQDVLVMEKDTAGEVVDMIKDRFTLREVDLKKLANVESLLALEARLVPVEGQILPFYAKGANITTPKHQPTPLQQ